MVCFLKTWINSEAGEGFCGGEKLGAIPSEKNTQGERSVA
jgi:hypothetical protein